MCEGLKCFAQIVTLIFSQPLHVIVRKNVGARASFETVQIKHLFILFQRANIRGSSIKYVHKIFRKTNISNPLIRTRTCAYQGVRNVSFSKNFASVLNGWPFSGIICHQHFLWLIDSIYKRKAKEVRYLVSIKLCDSEKATDIGQPTVVLNENLPRKLFH